MKGRRPKSRAAKVLRGTFRKDRPTRRELLPPPEDIGQPPDYIKGKALWAWRHFVSALAPAGRKTMDRRFRKKLESLCVHYAIWRDAIADLEKNGRTVTLYNGEGQPVNVCKNPSFSIAMQAAREFRFLFDGLESARGAGAKRADDEDDFVGDLINRGKAK